jgi:hypothetical protein
VVAAEVVVAGEDVEDAESEENEENEENEDILRKEAAAPDIPREEVAILDEVVLRGRH